MLFPGTLLAPSLIPSLASGDTKVQCTSRIDQRGDGGSKLVGLLRQHHDRIPFASPDTSMDNRIGCIQHRLGRTSGGSVYRQCMVHRGGNAPYKLPVTASSLPSGSMFCKRATSNNNFVEAGQCDSHDVYQQNGRDTLRTAVSTSPLPLAMVPREGDIFSGCAPTRLRECSSRPRVQSNEGSLRLDAKSHSIQTNSGSDGPLRGGLVCIPSDQTTASVYSWRPDPEAEGVDAFNQDWSQVRGFANPPWCLISQCLDQVKRQQARVVLITPLWNTQPWYPVLLELLVDYPRRLQSQGNLVKCPSTQDFIMRQGVPILIAWPMSGNPLHHEAFLQRLRDSCYPHVDKRQNVATTPLSQNGRIGVSKGIEILLLDL